MCKHGGAAEEASYRACRALYDERAPNAVRKAIAAAGGERAEGRARIIAIQQALATTMQYAVAGVEAGDEEGEREADKDGAKRAERRAKGSAQGSSAAARRGPTVHEKAAHASQSLRMRRQTLVQGACVTLECWAAFVPSGRLYQTPDVYTRASSRTAMSAGACATCTGKQWRMECSQGMEASGRPSWRRPRRRKPRGTAAAAAAAAAATAAAEAAEAEAEAEAAGACAAQRGRRGMRI